MEKIITYLGKNAKVNCDENCSKAFGINSRPRVQLSDDPDDFEYLSDSEVGIAPLEPDSYEGGETKPLSVDFAPNKWCVRQCERCNISQPGEHEKPLGIKTFIDKVKN